MVRIIINYAKRVGGSEKICVEVCPTSIFYGKEPVKPKIVNEESCIMCKACQVNCPSQAIEIST